MASVSSVRVRGHGRKTSAIFEEFGTGFERTFMVHAAHDTLETNPPFPRASHLQHKSNVVHLCGCAMAE